MIELTCTHHEHHETRTVHVTLRGQPAVPDYPPIPDGLALEFDLDIWDADRYDNTHGYCPGDDAVSRSIKEQGIWEGFETLLALDILGGAPGTFIDLGCQLGWYSVLAVLTDHPVLAVDGDMQCVRLAWRNLDRAARSAGPLYSAKHPEGQIQLAIFDGKPVPMPTVTGAIRLLKADVEGQELAALQSFQSSFEGGLVDYALVELTPAWGIPEAVEIVRQMGRWGYAPHEIPDKGYTRVAEFAADPLRETLLWCGVTPDAVEEWLTRDDQINVLFARPA